MTCPHPDLICAECPGAIDCFSPLRSDEYSIASESFGTKAFAEGGVRYRCVVCGRVFRSLKALHGHLRGACGEELTKASFHVSKRVWERFKGKCEEIGETTCSVLNSLIACFLEASRYFVVDSGLEFCKNFVKQFVLGREVRAEGGQVFMGPVFRPVVINIYAGNVSRSRLKYILGKLFAGELEGGVCDTDYDPLSEKPVFEADIYEWFCLNCGTVVKQYWRLGISGEEYKHKINLPYCPNCQLPLFPIPKTLQQLLKEFLGTYLS